VTRNLTAQEVARLRHRVGMHRVSDNLYLMVRPARGGGTRASWVFRYEADGVAHNMGLGSFSVFTLAEAKDRARKQRQLLADGIDPLQDQRARETAAKLEAAKAITFGAAAKRYVETHRLSWRNAKHAAQWGSVFEGSSRQSPITAAINDLPVGAIDTALAMKVLQPIWMRTPETASRVRQRCEAVIASAIALGQHPGPNPFAWSENLKELLPSPKKLREVKHHAALSYAEIGAFMKELRANDSISAKALELTILCATRTSETVNATWDEVDLRERTWTIPGSRMKSGKEHKVPLSDRAVELLAALPREDGTPFLFLGAKKGRPLSDRAMLELLRGMRRGLTVHGFRSSFRTWCEERTHYPHIVAELALGHTQNDKLLEAYQRSTLFEKRRLLMQSWADFCATPSPAGEADNVVRLGDHA
jgi:integrase